MKNIFIISTMILLLFSCNNEQELAPTNEENSLELVEQTFEGSTSFLFTGNSVYSKYFESNVDNEVAYYTTKENANNRYLFSVSRAMNVQRSGVGTITVSANGVDLKMLDNENIARAGVNTVYDSLFGKEVTFTFGDAAITRSSTGEEDNSINMYIPHIIDITYPEAIPYELDPLCPHDDLFVEWNKDENNTNGVVVIVEWDGHMVGQEYRWEGVRTIDVLEDTGEAILNPDMFEGIPDFALVNITLLRGNVDIVELENSPLKLYAASNSSIQVVLAKEPIQ